MADLLTHGRTPTNKQQPVQVTHSICLFKNSACLCRRQRPLGPGAALQLLIKSAAELRAHQPRQPALSSLPAGAS